MGSIIVGALVLAAGTLLMTRHRAALQESRRQKQTTREEEFAWRRFRRRMQASAMMAVIGIGLMLGQLPMSPLVALFYWGGVLLIVLWMMLLALADALNSYWYFRRVRQHQLRQHSSMTARLNAMRRDTPPPS